MSRIFWHKHHERNCLRAWLHTGSVIFNIEFNYGRGVSLSGARFCFACDEADLQVSVGVWSLFSLYLTIANILPRALREWAQIDWQGRETGFRLLDDYLAVFVWHCDGLGHRAGLYRGWFLKDILLGKADYSKRPIASSGAWVWLPEGSYPVMVTLHEDSWKRPRWPWPTVIRRATVDCGERGIPAHAGKGENAYDLDDDLVYFSTFQASTITDAARHLQHSILKDRRRYGPPVHLIEERKAELVGNPYEPGSQDAGPRG